MKRILDLLLGRPRVALSPSRLLAGEVTTPYGVLPSDEAVANAWRIEAGDRDCPPWLILGRRDAPSGSIWRLAWCPAATSLPPQAEIVLPEAAWALERLNDLSGPDGWHLRSLESPFGYWIGLWEGSRCEHLQAPGRDRNDAVQLERIHAARLGADHPPEILGEWAPPNALKLADVAEDSPESDLLGTADSIVRHERRSDATALARLTGIVVLFGLVTGLFGAFQLFHSHQRRLQEARLEIVRPLVERTANLEAARKRQIDSLRAFREALRPSQAPGIVISRIASKVSGGARLTALAIEETPNGWRVRTEARVGDWSAIQPFSESIRSVPGVSKASVSNQSRQAESISAMLDIEGVWP
ncbi:MAG: hypothetical protein AAB214_02445 [Fibrobacterota bacterium]